MSRPVIGIMGNSYSINDRYEVQACGETNIVCVNEFADCIPVALPAMPDVATVAEWIATFDGFVFTGGRANVHPKFYGQEATPAHGDFDLNRDELCLPLIRACVEQGVPILGLCRGVQEFNVAYGGTLHAEVRELPGKMNHRMPPDSDRELVTEKRHLVTLNKGGLFSQLYGAEQIMVNSLHGQALDQPGKGIVVDGLAEDGTIEAVHVEGASNFALGVQWHPELGAEGDDPSIALFRAFGAAARGQWKAAKAA